MRQDTAGRVGMMIDIAGRYCARMIKIRFAAIVLLLQFSFINLFSQQRLIVDTTELRKLIREWNFAHEVKSVESFNSLYADSVVFYSKVRTREDVKQTKQQLFLKSPAFSQSIRSELKWNAFVPGVLRCQFRTSLTNGQKASNHDTYLIIRYDSGRYRIIGESDVQTDKKLRFRLRLGDEIPIDTFKTDTSAVYGSTSSEGESAFSPSANINAVVTYLSSEEKLSVRRNYVFILVGMVLLGGILIVVADAVRHTGWKTKGWRGRKKKPNEFELYKAQSDFQAFATTLFDPLYFKRARMNLRLMDELPSALLFKFENKQMEGKFAVQTVFVPQVRNVGLKVFPSAMEVRLREFAGRCGVPLYYVVGLGGTPDEPQEIFAIPAVAMQTSFDLEELSTYRKHGMFFCHPDSGKLV